MPRLSAKGVVIQTFTKRIGSLHSQQLLRVTSCIRLPLSSSVLMASEATVNFNKHHMLTGRQLN